MFFPTVELHMITATICIYTYICTYIHAYIYIHICITIYIYTNVNGMHVDTYIYRDRYTYQVRTGTYWNCTCKYMESIIRK